jgi:DNA-binding MarR family transcriptional regulator
LSRILLDPGDDTRTWVKVLGKHRISLLQYDLMTELVMNNHKRAHLYLWSDVSRQDMNRALRHLAARGLVAGYRYKTGSRIQFWLVTEAGEALLRVICADVLDTHKHTLAGFVASQMSKESDPAPSPEHERPIEMVTGWMLMT